MIKSGKKKKFDEKIAKKNIQKKENKEREKNDLN